jgi:prepilin-type N-terminal cleavage/methylation domain-containing protein
MPRAHDRGFTLIELIIVVAIITVVAAIATPGLLRARMTANEASAIGSMKSITSAEIAYSASCGIGGFAPSLVVLGTPAPGTSVGFISVDLAQVMAPVKSGYTFTVNNGAGAGAGPNDCNGGATTTTYYATAIPLSFGISGGRSFAANIDSIVWQINAPAAPSEPFGAPAVPVQ